jgi:hypothetical protein
MAFDIFQTRSVRKRSRDAEWHYWNSAYHDKKANFNFCDYILIAFLWPLFCFLSCFFLILPNVEVQWVSSQSGRSWLANLHSTDPLFWLFSDYPQVLQADSAMAPQDHGCSRLYSFHSITHSSSNYLWCESVKTSSNESNLKISPHLLSPAL